MAEWPEAHQTQVRSPAKENLLLIVAKALCVKIF